jgi:CMP/dCMP kinase
MNTEKMVITISRQAGSGGSYVGHEVAKELGITYVDREILREAAEHLGRDDATLEEYEERSSGFLQNFVSLLSLGTPESPYLPPSERPIYDRDLFELESKIIDKIATGYDAVIIGRGAFHVLRNHPGALHVLVHAPRDFRARRLMEALPGSTLGEAWKKTEESDRRRAKFFKDMIGTSWTDARNYHLCIDTSLLELEESVRMIADFARKFHGSAQKSKTGDGAAK